LDSLGSLILSVVIKAERENPAVIWQVEHRRQAVLEVLGGAAVAEVAVRYGASKQSIYNWKSRFELAGPPGLQDRSRRPQHSPQRMPAEVESLACQLRRAYPRWGARRLVFELGRRGVHPVPVASTIHRALVRNGLVEAQRQQHRRKYKRWQREAPMHLWQMDLVGGIYLADGREAKVLSGIDDHSRFVVIATVLAVPNGRAVCEAFTAAMAAYGVPSEVLTDNGKQFTGRFTKPRPAEVLFERVCRENGITARLTKPRSPTTTGKIERWHQTLRRELLDNCGPFADLPSAQAAIDAWVHSYNHLRPHQSLAMATPASLFRPSKVYRDDLDDTNSTDTTHAIASSTPITTGSATPSPEAVRFDHRVPPGGVFAIVPGAQQIWLGPAWAGRAITVWANPRSIHLLTDGQLIKTIPSRLTPEHLRQALMRGARPGGDEPAPPALARVNGRLVIPHGAAIEVDRAVVRDGVVRMANRDFHVSADLVGRRITLRLDGHLMHAIAAGQLVGSWPCPVPADELTQVRQARPAAGPLPQLAPATPIQVQRRIPATGITMVARQRLRIGRTHAGKVVNIVVEDTHFRVLHGQEELSVHPRHPTNKPIRITAYNRATS
jgi:transposase InsO family protein